MKIESMIKLADLLTNPRSKYRILPDVGEFRLAGSTLKTGTFELVVRFEGNEMAINGHAGRQYLTSHTEGEYLVFKVTRAKGGIVKEDTRFDKHDAKAIVDWLNNWVNVEVAGEQ